MRALRGPLVAKLHRRLARRRPPRLTTDARLTLEDVIFPYFRGRDELEYWTIEKDRERSERYGAPRRITDALQNLTRYFGGDYFDLIICNGVFGWGRNDVPEHRPLTPEECRALGKLIRDFPPLMTSHVLTRNPNRHIYDFYAKASITP